MTIVYQTVVIGDTYSRAVNAPGAELFLALNLPPGLSMSTNGVISGTPAQAGRYAVSILARGPSGTGVAVLDITVLPLQIPVITSATIVNHEALTPLSYQITAVTPPPSSLPILSFGATNLPTGLTVNTSTGLITGTPSVSSQSPTVTVVSTISATNANGTGQTFLTFNFTQRPVITSSLTPLVFEFFTPITPYTITASKSPISFSASPLPAGLTLNSSTGVISGTPSSVHATTLVSLTASNGVLTSLPAVLSITVQPPVTTFTYSNGAPTTSLDLILSTSSYNTALNLTGVSISAAVTGIAANAFLGRNGLTSVTIPNNVATIGNSAFKNCIGLTNVSIGTGVTTIEGSTFEGCGGLLSVSLPNSVTSIEANAFYLCSLLASIVLPNSLQTIGQNAFRLSGITSITIPASVTSIQANGFYQCSNLVSFTVDASNPNYSSLSGVLFNKLQTQIVQYPPAKANSSYTIPSTVVNAVTFNQPFSFCNNLLNVVIPNSVGSLNDYAFVSCVNLVSVTCGNGFIFTEGVFSGCSSLNSVTFSGGSNATTIGAFAFQNCTALTTFNIPNNITSISGGAFRLSGITSITIPASVTSIATTAFNESSNLASFGVSASNPNYSNLSGVLFNKLQTQIVQYPRARAGTLYTIPVSVTSIGINAFEYCAGLTSVTIQVGVTSIGANAFRYCAGLTSITIPIGVTSIGNGAFDGCTGLTGTITIQVGVTSIGSRTFAGCNQVTSITIPSGVTSIMDNAFLSCTALTAFTIPNTVTSIMDSAFGGCTGLTGTITIPSSVYFLDSAFVGCSALTSINFLGNAPALGVSNTLGSNATVNYCSNKTGFTNPFGGRPAVSGPAC